MTVLQCYCFLEGSANVKISQNEGGVYRVRELCALLCMILMLVVFVSDAGRCGQAASGGRFSR